MPVSGEAAAVSGGSEVIAGAIVALALVGLGCVGVLVVVTRPKGEN